VSLVVILDVELDLEGQVLGFGLAGRLC